MTNKYKGELKFDTKVDDKTNSINVTFEGFKTKKEAEDFADFIHRGLTEWFQELNDEMLEKEKEEKDEPTRH